MQKKESDGWEKIRAAVAGLEAEGLYGLLRETLLIPPCPMSHLYPKNAATPRPPPFPNHSLRSLRKYLKPLLLLGTEQFWHQRSPLQPHHQLWRRLSPPIWNPFTCSCQVLKECINAGLKVAQRGHQPHMPISVLMCTECTWGEAVCPSCGKSFFNLDALRNHKKSPS